MKINKRYQESRVEIINGIKYVIAWDKLLNKEVIANLNEAMDGYLVFIFREDSGI